MLSHALKTEYLSDFGFFIRSLTTLTAPTQKTSLLSADNADITSFERMQKEKHFFCTHNARIVQMFLFYFLIISTGGKKKAGRQKRERNFLKMVKEKCRVRKTAGEEKGPGRRKGEAEGRERSKHFPSKSLFPSKAHFSFCPAPRYCSLCPCSKTAT